MEDESTFGDAEGMAMMTRLSGTHRCMTPLTDRQVNEVVVQVFSPQDRAAHDVHDRFDGCDTSVKNRFLRCSSLL